MCANENSAGGTGTLKLTIIIGKVTNRTVDSLRALTASAPVTSPDLIGSLGKGWLMPRRRSQVRSAFELWPLSPRTARVASEAVPGPSGAPVAPP